MSTTKINLGKVALTPKGEWSAGTTYERLDMISYQGSSYTVLKECKGITPSEGEYYSLLALKGAKGDKGDFADPVVSSFKGRTGAVVPQAGDYTPEMTGSAPAEHTHVPTSIGVFSKDETLQHIHMKSNENLLDNWYFPDPINQLGRTTYRCGVGGTGRISIDRWDLYAPSGTSGEVSIEQNGIKLDQIGDDGHFVFEQAIDIDYRMILGRNLTYSALLADGVFITDTIYIPDTLNEEIDSWGVLVDENNNILPEDEYNESRDKCVLWMDFIVYITEPRNKIIFRIGLNHQVSKTIIAAKVEISDHQTLVYTDTNGISKLIDPPPNRATELLKCQRYQFVVDSYNNDWAYLGTGLSRSDKERIYGVINIPVPMRCKPVLKLQINPDYDDSGATDQSGHKGIGVYNGQIGVLYRTGTASVETVNGNIIGILLLCNAGYVPSLNIPYIIQSRGCRIIFDANL